MAAMDDIEAEAYRLLVDPPAPRDSRPASKMKPNTRFLRHIVREANSHNAALLARETADSQRRLKRLMQSGTGGVGESAEDDDDSATTKSRDRDDRKPSGKDHRGRDSRGEKSSHRHRHRRDGDGRREDPDDRADSTRRHKSKSARSRRESRSRSRDRHSSRHRSSKHRRRSRSPEKEKEREGRLSPHHDRAYRDRSPRRKHRSSGSGRHKKENTHPSRSGTSSKRAASPERSPSNARSRSRSDSDGNSASSDSDPLDEFVGPRLASDSIRKDKHRVRMRGRGAFSAGSSMDRHFAADYDPAADVDPPPADKSSRSTTAAEARDEMQHDRKQLLRDGAERLRAAGFTDKEIAIWARGGRREVADVPWAKKGEAREWDRGKVEGDDGPAKPLWAR